MIWYPQAPHMGVSVHVRLAGYVLAEVRQCIQRKHINLEYFGRLIAPELQFQAGRYMWFGGPGGSCHYNLLGSTPQAEQLD